MGLERICAHRKAAEFMGNIIQLNEGHFQRRPPGDGRASQCRTASILFFTGVRYEYLPREEYAPCAKKTAKGHVVRLQAGNCLFDIPQVQ